MRCDQGIQRANGCYNLFQTCPEFSLIFVLINKVKFFKRNKFEFSIFQISSGFNLNQSRATPALALKFFKVK